MGPGCFVLIFRVTGDTESCLRTFDISVKPGFTKYTYQNGLQGFRQYFEKEKRKKSKYRHKTTKICTSSFEFYSVSGCVYVHFVGVVVVCLFLLFCLFVFC